MLSYLVYLMLKLALAISGNTQNKIKNKECKRRWLVIKKGKVGKGVRDEKRSFERTENDIIEQVNLVS